VRSPFLSGHVVLENLERRPRAFVAYRWKHGISDAVALGQLFAADRSEVDLGAIRLPGEGNDEGGAREALTPCRVERPHPERVQLHCRAVRAGYAVLLDEWTQGWSATLDGRPRPINAPIRSSVLWQCRPASTSSRCATRRPGCGRVPG
jgi:hypothetical protein